MESGQRARSDTSCVPAAAIHLEGVPRARTPAYERVLLYVDRATYQVRRVILIDVQGNRNQFDFDAPVVNVSVPPGEFAFKPPPGTRVVEK